MVITIAGDNKHAVKAEINSVINDFVEHHGSLAVEQFDGAEADIEQIMSAVSGGSLLSSEKLVVIDDFEASKSLVEHTEKLLESVPESTTLLITIGKLDKRLAYGKLLKKSTDYREFGLLSPQETLTWLIEAAKQKGGRIERSTAQYLLDFVGADQTQLSHELDKLILFDPQITRETINNLSERQPSSTVFELLDAGFNGQTKKALQLYDEQRRQQVEPLAIMGMIGWQLHILALTKTAGSKTAAEVAKDAGVHPFVVQKSLSLSKKMALSQLRQLVHHAVELEEQLKTRTMNADDAMKHFLLSM